MGRPKGSKNKNPYPKGLKKPGTGRPYNGVNYKQATHGFSQICVHRILAENALGRSLPIKAVVHHVNGGKLPGPIVICEDQAYHMLLHLRTRALEATGDAYKRRCSLCKQWDDVENLKQTLNRNEFRHSGCTREYQNRRYHVRTTC